MPITTALDVRSSNIPHNLEPSCDKISFGHFRKTPNCGAICLTASITTTAVTKARLAGAGSVPRNRTIVLAKRLPCGLSQIRPSRPRPPSWASARSHKPSGAPSAARTKRSALVEPVSGTSSNIGVRTGPLRHMPSKCPTQVWQDIQAANWLRQARHLSTQVSCRRIHQ